MHPSFHNTTQHPMPGQKKTPDPFISWGIQLKDCVRVGKIRSNYAEQPESDQTFFGEESDERRMRRMFWANDRGKDFWTLLHFLNINLSPFFFSLSDGHDEYRARWRDILIWICSVKRYLTRLFIFPTWILLRAFTFRLNHLWISDAFLNMLPLSPFFDCKQPWVTKIKAIK